MNETQESAWRIVDANANRAAEGLRTLEDFARLAAEDEVAARQVKVLRHALAQALQGLDRYERLQVRSTESDAGTLVSTDEETRRTDIHDVVPAACERVTQSLRQLEEFSKPISTAVAETFKQLRYQAYDDLAAVELRLCNRNSFPANARLYLLIDCAQPTWRGEHQEAERATRLDPFRNYVQALAAAGVDVFQLRDKTADGGKLAEYALAMKEAFAALSSERSPLLIINDRVDVALAVGANGVHLGQEDLSLADARRLVGNKMWIGISTHDLTQATEAEQGGADYIGCGPTFPSSTKQFDEFPGVDFSRSVANACALPAFAIGGIGEQNLGAVIETGIQGVAVSHAVHAAQNLESAVEAVRALKRQFESVRSLA